MKPMIVPTVPPIIAPIFSLSTVEGPCGPRFVGIGGILTLLSFLCRVQIVSIVRKASRSSM